VLDLVFTDEPNMIDNVGVMSCLGNSDHKVLFWTADVKVNPTVDSKCVRDYRRGNYDAMRKDLRSVNWNEALQGTTCEAWSVFKQQLSDVVSEHIPERKFPNGRKRKAIWMTGTARHS